jgi:hypothetical protein
VRASLQHRLTQQTLHLWCCNKKKNTGLLHPLLLPLSFFFHSSKTPSLNWSEDTKKKKKTETNTIKRGNHFNKGILREKKKIPLTADSGGAHIVLV